MGVLYYAFPPCNVWPHGSHSTVLRCSYKIRELDWLTSEAPSSLHCTWGRGRTCPSLCCSACTSDTSLLVVSTLANGHCRILMEPGLVWMISLWGMRTPEKAVPIHKTGIWAFPETHKDYYIESESGLYLERQLECFWTFQTGIAHGKITLVL